MSKNSYYVSKSKKKKEIRYLELEKLTGYNIVPKVHEDNMITVSKIVFINSEMTEKIIKKKVDKKIAYLLQQLKNVDEGDGTGSEIKRSLMDAEKLRLQLINNYVKYLGNTYHGLILKKLDIIIEELRYKLYMIEYKKQAIYEPVYETEEKESHRGR